MTDSQIYQHYQAAFDYRAMAREAAREREILQGRLRARKREGPKSPDKEQVWLQENRILYSMYLEQRANEIAFSRRAGWREKRGAI